MIKKYRKIAKIEAHQWFKNGDHPEDNCTTIMSLYEAHPEGFLSEGNVVRYYRTPNLDGQTKCKYCKNIMHNHGWVDTLEGGHIVCPGDWIIKGIQGEFYPCKPDIFKDTYEEVK